MNFTRNTNSFIRLQEKLGAADRKADLLLIGILTTHATLLAYSACVHSPAGDEVGHFPAGLSHWHLRRLDLYNVNPPLVRCVATLPAYLLNEPIHFDDYRSDPNFRSEFQVGRKWMAEHSNRIMSAFCVARWACIPFSVLGGIGCYLWARDLYGRHGGLLSCCFWSFSPTILGHGSMITPDVPAASLGLIASYQFWKAVQCPNKIRFMGVGLLLGISLLTKFTLAVLVLLWPSYIIARALLNRRCGSAPHGHEKSASSERVDVSSKPAPMLLALLSLSFGTALILVNVGYLFEDTLVPLKEYRFSSAVLSGDAANQASGQNRFKGTLVGELPVPFPRNFVLGVDHIKSEYERGYSSYLAGEVKHGGWWYYYIYAMLVKLPTGTLLLLALTAISLIYRFARKPMGLHSNGFHRDGELFVAINALTIIAMVSSQTGFNHHMRYVLPAFPFLFVLCGSCLNSSLPRSRLLSACATGCVVFSVASSLFVYPHSLAYFNEISGGPRNGWRLLDKSNLDWGQDLLLLKEWANDHKHCQPLFVACGGFADPEMFGIDIGKPGMEVSVPRFGEAWVVRNWHDAVGQRTKFVS